MTQKTENRLIKFLTIIVAILGLAVLIMLPHEGQSQFKNTAKLDTVVVLKVTAYRRLYQIIQQQQQGANDASKLLFMMDLRDIDNHVKILIDTVK